ncbi:hypothetical protein [Hymenobacter edaphi]|uniref:Lipoprotein n=1 Tax=Hymenobacter edaphi TaxID=2211146 RepID=A0A328BP83_9BACT|nr:hypothetical protein [Hymenobacter edaphi]RAK66848.1 hypothetical protein DLM85_11605 [Hymenobacter edaphi]
MKSVRLLACLIGFLGLSSIGSCEDDDVVPAAERPVPVSYAQTQCADRWGQATSTQQLEALARAYLQQQGIVASDVYAARTGQAAVCAACSCPTGVILQATVRQADLQAVLDMGFQRL